MNTRFKTNLGFALACLLIFCAMLSSNISTSKYIDDSNWMSQTLVVRGEIEKLSRLYIAAQSNIRGYHLSEQTYHLDLYKQAVAEINEALVKLRELTDDNLSQKQNLEKLTPLLADKIQIWDGSLEMRRKDGFEAIKAGIRADKAKNQDFALHAAIETLSREENNILGRRTEQAQRQAYFARVSIGLGGAMACLLIILAAFIVNRDIVRREQAEANIDRFFTLSLDLLCISGMDGNFKRLSPSFVDVLGYPLKELYSKPIVHFVHPEDIEKTNNEIQSQLQGNKVLSFENRFRCKDGSYKIFSWKSVPVDQLMYAVARDITQQKQFEADLVLAREAAQKAAITKSSFLANMSHEIRTPLNGVVGMTDVLSRTNLDLEQKKYVGAIRSSSNILLKIVNEILDFSKIEAGQVKVELIDFELVRLIEEHVSLIGVLAHNKGLKLETVIDPKIPSVLRGDSVKISQSLLNLINNAIKFTDQGTVLIKAEALSLNNSQCQLKLSVTDTGIGISAQQAEHLFKPFVQADSSTARKYGGTGLGLSICKRFVEMMNGQIGVASNDEQGSIFWMTVNLEVSPMDSLKSMTAQDAPTVVISNLNQQLIARRESIRILIAEDNRMNQMIVMDMMKILGYTATLVENGEDAVKQYVEGTYDLILMDQHMPVMDGIESSTEIRKIEKETQKHIPIIAFTATVVQEEQKEIFKKLMDDFILKPVSLMTLESVLAKWEQHVIADRSKYPDNSHN